MKIAIYVVEQGSSIAYAKTRAIEIIPPAQLTAVDGIRITGAIDLPAGDYSVRVLIEEPGTARTGLRQTSLTVPSARQAVASALEIANISSTWLDVPLDGPQPPAGFFPSAIAVLPVEQPLTVRAYVAGTRDVAIENSGSLGPEGLAVEGWDFSEAEENWSLAEATVQPHPELAGRFEIAPIAMTAAAAGRQTIGDVVVQDSGGATLARGGVSEVLLTPQVEQPTSWTTVKRNTEAANLPSSRVSTRVGKKLAMSKSDFRSQMLAALRSFANDDLSAKSRLAELEATATGGSGEALVTLADLELKTFESILQRQPKAIVPILLLYLDRYTEHLDRREFLMSTHCKRIAIALAQQAAQSNRSSLAPTLADFLTVMGGMQVMGNDPSGLNSLETALHMSPGHLGAATVLSWHLERTENYAAVVDLVDSIAEPTADLRLRQALSKMRLGQNEGLAELRRLAERDDWVGLLALQELIRVNLGSGSARDLIDRGLERFPDNPKLRLLAALAYDLQGQPRKSLEQVVTVQTSTAEGERHRYARDPREVMAATRSALNNVARDNRVALAEVLRMLT